MIKGFIIFQWLVLRGLQMLISCHISGYIDGAAVSKWHADVHQHLQALEKEIKPW